VKQLANDWKYHKMLFLFLLPATVLLVMFCYVPMGGLVIAFQDYRVTRGITGSTWVWLKHFKAFFASPNSYKILRNTFLLNVYDLIFGFPIPIVFAIALCELRGTVFRKIIQTVSYLPYFISAVVVASLVNMLFSVDGGMVNTITGWFGAAPVNFLIEREYFRGIYVGTNIWRNFGWSAIIFIAAIMGIDPQLHEAAIVDGASSIKRILNVTVPGIMSTIVVMLLLRIGNMMSTSFELVNLLQRPLTYEVSDTIQTYIYRRGIASAAGIPEYSLTTAIGLFQSVVNTTLLVGANAMAKKFSESSLF
jgi:putative aldouronate transport system permease protein